MIYAATAIFFLIVGYFIGYQIGEDRGYLAGLTDRKAMWPRKPGESLPRWELPKDAKVVQDTKREAEIAALFAKYRPTE